MTLRCMIFGFGMLVACGDSTSGGGGSPGGSAADGGSSAGGASEGGASGGETNEGATGAGGATVALELEIASDELSTATCATYSDGHWATGETSFDANGEVVNLECALVAVFVDGEPFWITSGDFDGTVGDSDLRHSFSSAEALIEIGSKRLVLGAFSGALEVLTLGSDSVEIRIE